MRKAIIITSVIILTFVFYEVFAFYTYLVKPIVAPVLITGIGPDSSEKIQTWYETISYLVGNPKQMDVVVFNDQLESSRIGIVETIISTDKNNERLYRIRLFLGMSGNYYTTVPISSILGKILPSKEISLKLESDDDKAKTVPLNTLAPILQKIQKELSGEPMSLFWNKPQVNSRQNYFFSVKDDDAYGILVKNVPYIEFATTADLSEKSILTQQILESISKVVSDNEFEITPIENSDPSDYYTRLFEIANNDYVCSEDINWNSQISLTAEESKVMRDSGINSYSDQYQYWTLRLACITRQEFESTKAINKPFIEDLGLTEKYDPIFVEKISGNFASIRSESRLYTQKINGHWKIIYNAGQEVVFCSELEKLHIPTELREGCLQTQ